MSEWQLLYKKICSLRDDENGAVIIMTLGMFLFIYVLCVSVYVIGTAVEEKMHLQDIADAASYSMSVAQADGLSRIATINRAMSWTYIQMTRRQMDYIVNNWLKETVKRFDEDLEKCKEWNSKACKTPSFKVADGALYIYEPQNCGKHSSGTEDTANTTGTYWAGWTPGDGHQIRIGYITQDESQGGASAEPEQYGKLISKETLQEKIMDDQSEKALIESIQNDMMMLNVLDVMMIPVCMLTMDDMKQCGEQILTNSIPPDERDDYRFILKTMAMVYPYSVNILDPSQPLGNDEERAISVLSPYKNTEEDELEFLSMTMGTASLHDIFGDGIDQWFVRGKEVTLTDTGKIVTPDLDNYRGEIIQRGYKTANRKEAGMEGIKESPVYRANHVSTGNILGQAMTSMNVVMSLFSCPELLIPLMTEVTQEGGLQKLYDIIQNFMNCTADMNPSCFNSKKFFAEQCYDIDDNYGLVSEYHWASMRWWCPIETRIQFFPPLVTTTAKDYKLFPLIKCEKHGYDSQNDAFTSHTRDEYRSCVIGVDDVSGMLLNTHNSSNNLNGYITAGHARIYGDDKGIYDENIYIGEPAMPVKLNEKFFRDANVIALAKRRRNPLTAWISSNDEKLDSGNLIDSSLYALFNMLRKSSTNDMGNNDPRWICAISASRAAYRERATSNAYNTSNANTNTSNANTNFLFPNIIAPPLILNYGNASSGNDNYLPGRVYQTKYNVLTSDQLDQANESSGPIRLRIAADSAGNGGSTAKLTQFPYRIGCPHAVSGNQISERLKNTWNLCETDWDAVFLPIQYSYGAFSYSATYDGLKTNATKNLAYKQGKRALGIGDLMEDAKWQKFDSSLGEAIDVDILNSHNPSTHYKPSFYTIFNLH